MDQAAALTDNHGKLSGREALLALISSGELESVRLAIRKTNLQDAHSLVLQSVHYRQLEILKLLLKQGAPPDAVDSDGNSAVMWAAGRSNGIGMQRSLSSLRVLIEFGANVNYINRKGFTPLMAASLIVEVECVRVLIKAGALIDAVDAKGESALTKAVDANAKAIVKILIEAGANVNVCNKVGYTLLMRASSIEIAEKLLVAGADVRCSDIEGYTALHHQVERNKWEIAKVLIEYGAPLNATTNCNIMPLQLSIRRKSYLCTTLLLESGSKTSCTQELILEALLPWDYFNTWNVFNSLNTWPLWREMITYSSFSREFTHKLLREIKEPCHIINTEWGVTPVMLAAACDDEWAVKYLVEQRSCDPVAKDKESRSALSYACRSGNVRILKYLIFKGCCPNEEDSKHNLPIYYGAYFGHQDVIMSLIIEFAYYMKFMNEN